MSSRDGNSSGRPPAGGASSSLRRRILADRLAAFLIAGGGIGVVIAILLIFLFIGREAVPLIAGSRLGEPTALALTGGGEPWLVGTDSFQDLAWHLDGEGHLAVVDRTGGGVQQQLAVELDSRERITASALDGGAGAERFLLGTSAGRLLNCRLNVRRVSTDEGRHSVAVLQQGAIALPPDSLAAAAGPVERLAWARGENRSLVVWTAAGRPAVAIEDRDEETWSRLPLPAGLADLAPVALAVAPSGERLALGLASGELVVLDLRGGVPGPVLRWDSGLQRLTALTFQIGSGRLVAGDNSGRLASFMETRDSRDQPAWIPALGLEHHQAPIVQLAPGPRDRSLLSVDAQGLALLHYTTTGRTLLSAQLPAGSRTLSFSPRSDAVVAGGAGLLQVAKLDNPHPEISWRALFGQLHYEGYGEAASVWQSTGGSDDFESKFGLLPLIFGTLKGTFFALLISVPLALLGAIYISQFAPTWLARTIKPAIEIMAALPSVIVGFLAGLVFAPYLETHLSSVLAFTVLLPLLVVLMVPVWQRIPGHRLGPKGLPQLAQGLVLTLVALATAYALGPWLDAHVFGGSLIGWLHGTGGIVYDQRNSLVVGFALGFAVIPIIFTMAEDALSNVPDALVNASLALGASRWTTVARVVLPGAAAGVFAAVMIGLGRAIGETMIVLMATGNTPLMDASPFNGFRALSACIAVEIPEAPMGGTLYRVLFLQALLLFLFTFVINTAASWIGERLRKSHGRF
jgi:phosphate transport system permease protein